MHMIGYLFIKFVKDHDNGLIGLCSIMFLLLCSKVQHVDVFSRLNAITRVYFDFWLFEKNFAVDNSIVISCSSERLSIYPTNLGDIHAVRVKGIDFFASRLAENIDICAPCRSTESS